MLNIRPHTLIEYPQYHIHEFLSKYISYNYAIHIDDIPGQTPWDKFLLVHHLTRSVDTLFSTVAYSLDYSAFSNILTNAVKTESFKLFEMIFNRLSEFIYTKGLSKLNSSFKEAFMTALNTNQLQMAQLIMRYYDIS